MAIPCPSKYSPWSALVTTFVRMSILWHVKGTLVASPMQQHICACFHASLQQRINAMNIWVG